MSGGLPPSWDSPQLIDAVDLIMDYRGRTPKKLGLDWGGGTIRAISARNVRMGYVDFSVDHYLGSERLYRRWMSHGDMRGSDVLFTTEAPLGNVALVPDDHRYILSQRTILLRAKNGKLDPIFFAKYLQSPLFQRLLLDNATGSTALGIQRKRLERLPVIAPPLPEQRKIGQALDDVDRMIASLERLIAKKSAIKHGMMQELLIGRKRLSGFAGEWHTRKLGDVASVVMGQSPSGRSYNTRGSGTPLIQGNADIRDRRTFDRVWTTEPTKHVRAGDVVLTVRAPVGYTAIASKDACLGRGVCGISAGGATPFLFHALVAAEPTWVLLEQGSTFTSVNSAQVRAFEIRWPDDADERAAIANVLNDADGELEGLERRLQATRSIKQGMMQELLTGRTRLVPSETVA